MSNSFLCVFFSLYSCLIIIIIKKIHFCIILLSLCQFFVLCIINTSTINTNIHIISIIMKYNILNTNMKKIKISKSHLWIISRAIWCSWNRLSFGNLRSVKSGLCIVVLCFSTWLNRFSSTSWWYLFPTILPVMAASFPVPPAEKQP